MDLQEAFDDIQAAALEINPSRVGTLLKFAAGRRQSYERGDFMIASAICKTAFEVSERTDEAGYKIAEALLSDQESLDTKRKLASLVYQSLGSALFKQAGIGRSLAGVQRFITGATRLGIATTPELAKMFTAAALATGAAGGAGAWALEKKITGEDNKLRDREIQRDTYGRLAAEIQAELERRKLQPSPKNTAAVVDYLT